MRLRVPDEGETVVRDVIRGDSAFENRLLDDFVIARVGSHAALQLRGRGRRHRHGDHARGARRRPPLEHARASCWCWRRSGREPPLLRAPAAAARHRRQAAVEAPRRRLGRRSCATPATCPRPCATTWRCWAGATTRDDLLHDRGADRAASRSSACPAPRPCSTSRSSRWMNGHYIREMDPAELATRRGRVAARAAACPGADDPRLEQAVAAVQEKMSTLAEFRRLAGFAFATDRDRSRRPGRR